MKTKAQSRSKAWLGSVGLELSSVSLELRSSYVFGSIGLVQIRLNCLMSQALARSYLAWLDMRIDSCPSLGLP